MKLWAMIHKLVSPLIAPLYLRHSLCWCPTSLQQNKNLGSLSYWTPIGVLTPSFCWQNRIFVSGLVMSTKILTRTIGHRHSLISSVCTSSTFSIRDPSFSITYFSIHIRSTLCSCTHNEVFKKDCFFISPIPVSSVKTIKALSKCQGPLVNTFFSFLPLSQI